jgi:hypothetical protein
MGIAFIWITQYSCDHDVHESQRRNYYNNTRTYKYRYSTNRIIPNELQPQESQPKIKLKMWILQ